MQMEDRSNRPYLPRRDSHSDAYGNSKKMVVVVDVDVVVFLVVDFGIVLVVKPIFTLG